MNSFQTGRSMLKSHTSGWIPITQALMRYFTNFCNQRCPGPQSFSEKWQFSFWSREQKWKQALALMKFKSDKNNHSGINVFTFPVQPTNLSTTFLNRNEFFLIFLLCNWKFKLYRTWMVSWAKLFSSCNNLLVDLLVWILFPIILLRKELSGRLLSSFCWFVASLRASKFLILRNLTKNTFYILSSDKILSF